MNISTIERVSDSRFSLDGVDGNQVTVHDLSAGAVDLSVAVKDYSDIAKRCEIDQMQFLVDFGGLFRDLIGEIVPDSELCTARGLLDPERIRPLGYRVLELESPYALAIAKHLTKIALMINEKGLVPKICTEYAKVADEGFTLMREMAPLDGVNSLEGTLNDDTRIVSLERGSLPITRMVLGRHQDDEIEGELRVVAKRIHLHDKDPLDLANLIQWRNEQDASEVLGKRIIIPDFVVASYASTFATLITQRILSGQLEITDPVYDSLAHRSFAVTWQGLLKATQLIRSTTGVETPEFVSLALGFELNRKYYLAGARAVSDAGDVLEAAGLMPRQYSR